MCFLYVNVFARENDDATKLALASMWQSEKSSLIMTAVARLCDCWHNGLTEHHTVIPMETILLLVNFLKRKLSDAQRCDLTRATTSALLLRLTIDLFSNRPVLLLNHRSQ